MVNRFVKLAFDFEVGNSRRKRGNIAIKFIKQLQGEPTRWKLKVNIVAAGQMNERRTKRVERRYFFFAESNSKTRRVNVAGGIT